jgi:hypothetical protein
LSDMHATLQAALVDRYVLGRELTVSMSVLVI